MEGWNHQSGGRGRTYRVGAVNPKHGPRSRRTGVNFPPGGGLTAE